MPRRAASPEVITIEESDEEKPLKSLPTIPWRAPLNLPLCDDGSEPMDKRDVSKSHQDGEGRDRPRIQGGTEDHLSVPSLHDELPLRGSFTKSANTHTPSESARSSSLPLPDSVQASDVCHQRAKKLDVKATAVEDTLEASNGVAPAASPEVHVNRTNKSKKRETMDGHQVAVNGADVGQASSRRPSKKSLFLLSSSDDDDDDDSDDIYKGKDRDDDDKNAGDPFPGQTAKEQRKRTVSDVLFATASEVSPLAKKCPASEPDKAKTTTSRTCDTTSRVARQTKDRKRKSGDLAAVDKYEPQGFSAREAIAIPLSGWTDEQFGWLNYAIREVMACHMNEIYNHVPALMPWRHKGRVHRKMSQLMDTAVGGSLGKELCRQRQERDAASSTCKKSKKRA
ncbi:uncharacterized protein PSFLO_01493 [Pseudozyma flocculosa]|uniref:Uncharacterized protein n=1 Tax=Pseudozyma flocculosa TaxID=84751 RepID=A0A5C3EVE3_9BASI|nr:uncharacterized protein PSFLO_01493 [Pseudozyma flocculosa]